jgi:hypothetical protein
MHLGNKRDTYPESVKERRPKSTYKIKLRDLKYRIKVLWKGVRRKTKHYPYRKITFKRLLELHSCSKQSLVYNRFESTCFQTKLVESSLLKYKKTNTWNGMSLPVEGEENRPYRIQSEHVSKTPDVYCHSLNNAGVTGGEGFIYDSGTNRYISETLRHWFTWDKGLQIFYRGGLHYNKPKFLPGITLSLAKPGADSYFHFIYESLTIFLLFRRMFPTIIFDYLIVNAKETDFKRNWLTYAGVTTEKIIYAESDTHLVCEQLLFVSDLCYQYSPNLLNTGLLHDLIRDKPSVTNNEKKNRIIIASRASSKVRNLTWENELAEKSNGMIVDFEKLLPGEVIDVCQNCDIFIGPHGAAFSNIVFCKPGTQVIEIAFGTDEILYSRLADVCGLEHILFDISQKNDLLLYLEQIKSV